MKTVYVVTTGDYSDYHICAICSTRKIAKEAVAAYGADTLDGKPRIDKWGLDEWPKCPPGMDAYYVNMHRNGDVERVHKSESIYDIEAAARCDVRGHGYACPPGPQWLWAYVFATSEEHAVKIVNERRTKLIATGEWKAAKDD